MKAEQEAEGYLINLSNNFDNPNKRNAFVYCKTAVLCAKIIAESINNIANLIGEKWG